MKFPSLNKFLTETPSNSHTAPEKGPNQGDTCRMQCEQKQSMFSSRVFFFFFIGSEEESHLEYQEKECQCGNERLHQWSWLNFYTSEAGRVRYINLSVLKLISFPSSSQLNKGAAQIPWDTQSLERASYCGTHAFHFLIWQLSCSFSNYSVVQVTYLSTCRKL